MSDTIIFLSAYETIKLSKSKPLFRKRKKSGELLQKYHIEYMMLRDKIVFPHGGLLLDMEYDYINQKTALKYEYKPFHNKFVNINDELEKIAFCIKIIHSHSLLADDAYFKIDYFLPPQPFIVYIDEDIFQIDPVVF